MREAYLPPEVVRVASVEDLTLASGQGALIDICIVVGVPLHAEVSAATLSECIS
jgi:hypothetical protein